MAHQYRKTFKICATCNYWGGSRQIDSQGQVLTVDSSTSKGKCLIQLGPWKGRDKNANATCVKWQKWVAFK